MRIPFNRPFRAPRENEYALEALRSGRLSGNNQFHRNKTDRIGYLIVQASTSTKARQLIKYIVERVEACIA